MPFDWMILDTKFALSAVAELIETDFKYFLSDLRYNADGHVIPQKHPYVKFVHHDPIKNITTSSDISQLQNAQLIKRENLTEIFTRRANRFLNLIDNESCFFIHTIPRKMLYNDERARGFEQSAARFVQFMEQRTQQAFQLLVVVYNTNDFDIEQATQKLSLPSSIHLRPFVIDANVNPYFGCSKTFGDLLAEFDLVRH